MGVVDRLFRCHCCALGFARVCARASPVHRSRVGADDDVSNHRSTFLVEMEEAAAILTQATPRSLVLIDELGRGTATYDGMALAWAVRAAACMRACIACAHVRMCKVTPPSPRARQVLEELCTGAARPRALFATHYHELASAGVPGVRPCTVAVHDMPDGTPVITHQLVPGKACGSYGLHVARRAGVPEQVVQRAFQLLRAVQAGALQGAASTPEEAEAAAADAAAAPIPPAAPMPPAEHPAVVRLRGVDVDALAPRAALQLLYELRALAREERSM